VTELELEGCRGSRPVQVGNGAATQLQLGNFGDLFETISRYVRQGNAIDPTTGVRLAEIADLVCRVWRNDDSGFWELGDCRSYTSSKMACWLALTRAAELARDGQVPADGVDRWLAEAEEIRDYVETACWSDAQRSYAFYAGSDELDCSVLRASLFGFADPRSERMSSTIDALRRELGADGPLVYRYTGMASEEGCFLACSFWIVTALAKAGRVDEARALLDELVERANDVGLYSEEMDPRTLELLGNFPQALTHLALIQAAFAIEDAEHEDGGAA
jgi:pentatricopeptide repeat protein